METGTGPGGFAQCPKDGNRSNCQLPRMAAHLPAEDFQQSASANPGINAEMPGRIPAAGAGDFWRHSLVKGEIENVNNAI